MKKIRKISIIIITILLIGMVGYNYYCKQKRKEGLNGEPEDQIRTVLGIDNDEIEIEILSYEKLENDSPYRQMIHSFKANISFDKDQKETILKEMDKKKWLVYPGIFNAAFGQFEKEIYSKKTGQPADSIVMENIYKLYLDNDYFRLGIENVTVMEGDMYYWQSDDDTYELYLKYSEYIDKE